jgi:hypothetical protein
LYPMHKDEGGDPKTDSYVWRRVRLTEETGAGRNVKLEVWDGGAFKLVADRVFFDAHEHFDPDFLWYSDYAPPGQSSPGIVERPSNVADEAREGWLLVAQAKLSAAGIDPSSAATPTDTTRAPKWPKNVG